MARFMVVYDEGVEDQLTDAWLDAAPGPDRDAITAASHQIDSMLANDPLSCGEPEHEGLRRLDVPPLHVLYIVEEADRRVRVVLVRPAASPPPNATSNGPTDPNGQGP